MLIGESFRTAYRELEERMKALAETDGDVFLPNPEPLGTAQYIIICMEPSLGHWARSVDQARSRVEAGFRNFLSRLRLRSFTFVPGAIFAGLRTDITSPIFPRGRCSLNMRASRGPNDTTD